MVCYPCNTCVVCSRGLSRKGAHKGQVFSAMNAAQGGDCGLQAKTLLDQMPQTLASS